MDTFSDRDYYAVDTKMAYVLLILMILYGLNHSDSIEAPVRGEDDSNYTDWMGSAKPVLGTVVLIGFILYGLVYPIATRMGCCGFKYCKRTKEQLDSDHDHIIDEPQELQISKTMMVAIMHRMNTIREDQAHDGNRKRD